MKKNINKKIDGILNPDAVVDVSGLKKSNPKYKFHILNAILNCVWNSVYNNKYHSSYCIKDKVGNTIHFNDEVHIEICNDIDTIVRALKKCFTLQFPKHYVTTYEYFCQEDSGDNDLHFIVNEYIGTNRERVSRGAGKLFTPISELKEEDYHALASRAIDDLNRKFTMNEEIFIFLHSYNKSKKNWKIRHLTF